MRKSPEHVRNQGVPYFRHKKQEGFATGMVIMGILGATAVFTPFLAEKISQVVNLPRVETRQYRVPMEGYIPNKFSPYRNPVVTYREFLGIRLD